MGKSKYDWTEVKTLYLAGHDPNWIANQDCAKTQGLTAKAIRQFSSKRRWSTDRRQISDTVKAKISDTIAHAAAEHAAYGLDILRRTIEPDLRRLEKLKREAVRNYKNPADTYDKHGNAHPGAPVAGHLAGAVQAIRATLEVLEAVHRVPLPAREIIKSTKTPQVTINDQPTNTDPRAPQLEQPKAEGDGNDGPSEQADPSGGGQPD